MDSHRTKDLAWLVLILVATFSVYVKTLSNGYTYDDRMFVSAYTRWGRNTMVVDDHNLGDYFKTPMGHGLLESSRGFRPITVMTYAATHRLARTRIDPPRKHLGFPENMIMQEWEDPAGPHHLVNLVLHVLGTCFVYFLVRNFTGPGMPALSATAVFGLHALRSDPVCSIVGRGELLPFVLGAGGTLLYVLALRQRKAARWLLLAAVMLCLQTAFLCKESAVAFSVFVPLYTVCLHKHMGERPLSSCKRQLVPFLLAVTLPAVVFFVLHLNFLKTIGAQEFEVSYLYNHLYHLGLGQRLPSAVMIWGYGLFQVFFPFSLACDYGWRVFETVGYGDWRFWLAGLVLLGVLVGGLIGFRRSPLLFLSMAAFLGFSFITSNIPTPIETIFGERLLYTPALGLSLLVAVLVRRWRKCTTAIILPWLMASAGVCVKRSFDWESNQTLFAVDAETQPRSVAMQMGMARNSRLQTPPDWEKRELYLHRILAIDPRSFSARNELAADLMSQRRFAEAETILRAALRHVRAVRENRALRDPDFEMRSPGMTILTNLGTSLQHTGRLDEARECFEEALRVGERNKSGPVARGARLALMWLAWEQGDSDRVERLLRESEPMFPQDPVLEVQRGLLVWSRGDHVRAAQMLAESLERADQNANMMFAWDALVESCLRSRQPRKAVQAMAEQAELLLQLGDIDRAEMVVKRGLGHSQTSLRLHKSNVWLAWEREELASVRPRLKAALSIAPQDPELWIHRGLLEVEAGNLREAARILNQTVPRFPATRQRLRGWLALSDTLVRLGELENARRTIQEVCRRNRTMPVDYAKRFLALYRRTRERTGD